MILIYAGLFDSKHLKISTEIGLLLGHPSFPFDYTVIEPECILRLWWASVLT